MNRRLVRFKIEAGPEWNIYHNYHDEKVKFSIIKEMYMSDGQLHPILAKPAEITVLVDRIAAPIHTDLKPIRGKVIGNVQGEVLPENHDDIGLLFLSEGANVLVRYWINKHKGYITFEGAHASREWQITKTHKDGLIYRLESAFKFEDEQGICYEITDH